MQKASYGERLKGLGKEKHIMIDETVPILEQFFCGIVTNSTDNHKNENPKKCKTKFEVCHTKVGMKA